MSDLSDQLSKIHLLDREQLADFLKQDGFGSEVYQIFIGEVV